MGVPSAQYCFWVLARPGKGASDYLHKAAAAGFLPAQFELARGGSAEARAICIAAADGGDAEAMWMAAQLLLTSEPKEPKDAAKADWYLRRAAERKSLRAMTQLGVRLAQSNPKEAMEFLKKAADGGEVSGLTHYGVHLLEGDLGLHDVNEGFRYLKLAADRSSAAAMWAIATLYAQGRGCERDLAQAADYAERAMEIGDPDLTREGKRRLDRAPGLREELDRRSKSRSK